MTECRISHAAVFMLVLAAAFDLTDGDIPVENHILAGSSSHSADILLRVGGKKGFACLLAPSN